jgi:hypothetical protein
MARKTQIRQDLVKGAAPPFTCTASESVGDLVYVSGANAVAQADASSLSTSEVVGFVLLKSSATACQVTVQPGPVTGASGLTAGDPVYLSETPGAVTAVAPANVVQVGIATSATEWFFTGAGGGSSSTLTPSDKALNPTATVGDNASTGITISATPVNNSYVQVQLNGMQVILGDGVKTTECYFSGDSGTTARNIADIASGDELFWNGLIATFSLGVLDVIDLNYLVAA